MRNGPVEPDKTYYFDRHKKLGVEAGSPALEAIKEINEEYKDSPFRHFRTINEAMRPPVSPDGPAYAFFKDEDSSTDTALVVSMPFANSIQPNEHYQTTALATEWAHDQEGGKPKIDSSQWSNAEKHYALFRILKAMGVADAEGRNIPVIAIAAPSQDWKPNFSKADKAALAQGNFSPFTPYIQDILDKEGIGQVHIGGYSLGASIGHSAMRNLINADVLSATLGEVPTYKNRSRAQMFNNYVLNRPSPANNSGIKSEEKWTISGPQARTDLEEYPNRWQKNLYKQGLENAWVLIGAMGKPTMFADLKASLRPNSQIPTTLEYGDTSALTHDIESYLAGSDVIAHYKQLGKLRIVKSMGHEAVGAPHLHGESPLFYGLWMAESILWALEASKKSTGAEH